MITGGSNLIDNTKILMKLRSLYEKEGYPIRNALALPYSLNMDFYKLKPFYGRIDYFSNSVTNCQIQNGVVLESANITNFPRLSVKAMNFVVDAFLEMQTFFRNGVQSNLGLLREGVLADVVPTIGWSSPFKEYDTHIQNISNRFLNSEMFLREENKIVSFQQFIKVFYLFVEDEIKNFPITYSNYVLSKFINPRSSGLMIDLVREDVGDDFIKTSQFIENANFTWFQECTSRYGFYIDQQAPWRIVANISSKIMQGYMQKYSVNESKELFDKKFIKSYTFDETLMYKLLTTVYNNFVKKIPVAVQVKTPNCVNRVDRKEITISEAKILFPANKFIKFYSFLRARELEISIGENKINQNQFNVILNNAQTVFNTSNMLETLKFINNYFNSYGSQIIKNPFLTSKNADGILQPEKTIPLAKNEKIKINL